MSTKHIPWCLDLPVRSRIVTDDQDRIIIAENLSYLDAAEMVRDHNAMPKLLLVLASLEYVCEQEDKFKSLQINGRSTRDQRIRDAIRAVQTK